LDLGRTFPKNVLLEVEETVSLEESVRCASLEEIEGIVPLEEGIRCSFLEEIEDTVPLQEGVGCSSLEELTFIVGPAASANSL
jgi:hypothetical protein